MNNKYVKSLLVLLMGSFILTPTISKAEDCSQMLFNTAIDFNSLKDLKVGESRTLSNGITTAIEKDANGELVVTVSYDKDNTATRVYYEDASKATLAGKEINLGSDAISKYNKSNSIDAVDPQTGKQRPNQYKAIDGKQLLDNSKNVNGGGGSSGGGGGPTGNYRVSEVKYDEKGRPYTNNVGKISVPVSKVTANSELNPTVRDLNAFAKSLKESGGVADKNTAKQLLANLAAKAEERGDKQQFSNTQVAGLVQNAEAIDWETALKMAMDGKFLYLLGNQIL